MPQYVLRPCKPFTHIYTPQNVGVNVLVIDAPNARVVTKWPVIAADDEAAAGLVKLPSKLEPGTHNTQ